VDTATKSLGIKAVLEAMEGKAKLLGHAIHPMLIVFPSDCSPPQSRSMSLRYQLVRDLGLASLSG
jgi:hypothetical protein